MNFKLKQLAAAMLMAVMALPAFAGWVITENRDGTSTVLYYQDGKIVQNDEDTGEMMIFNADQGTITYVINKNQAYWTGTPKEFQQSMINMMKGALAQMPDEQKPMMQSMINEMEKNVGKKVEIPNVEIKNIGSGPEVAGYSTQWYEIYANGQLKEKLALADDITISDEINVKNFMDMVYEFSSIMGGQEDPSDNYNFSKKYLDLLSKGYIMKSSPVNDMTSSASEVTKAEKTNIPDSKLNPPSNYKKLSAEEFGAIMMQQ